VSNDRPRKITIRLTDEEFQSLDQVRARSGRKFQQIGLELFSQWAAGPDIAIPSAGFYAEVKYTPQNGAREIPSGGIAGNEPSVYSKNATENDYASEIAMFVRLLRDGPPVVRRAIIENVRAFDTLREMISIQHDRSEPETVDEAEARLAILMQAIEADMEATRRSLETPRKHSRKKTG
jgi:hypothetical protein